MVGLGSRSSTAVAWKKSTLKTVPGHRQLNTMLLGQVMTGGVVSRTTVMVKVQVLRFVQSSVAVQVTVVVPTGNELPDAGVQVTVTLGSRLSVAVGGVKVTGTVAAEPQYRIVRLVGH